MGEWGVSHDQVQELKKLMNQVRPSHSDADVGKPFDDDRPRATFQFGDDESPVASRKASLKVPADDDQQQTVHFQLGGDLGGSEDNLVWQKRTEGKENVQKSTEGVTPTSSRSDVKSHRHKHKHHHYYSYDGYNKEDLMMRRHKGSEVEVQDVLKRVPTELEEAITLQKADLDEMASHRREDMSGLRRHMIERKKHRTVSSFVSIGKSEKKKWKELLLRKKYDHSPHEMFVELDELYVGENKDIEWREKARWIKFEEDVEEGAERWGKPHVASLSFHSLLELRRGLEQGALLLDLEASDLSSIVHNVVENMVIHDQIRVEDKANIIRTLLLKHKHQRDELSLMKTLTSSTSFHTSPSSQNVASLNRSMSEPDGKKMENHLNIKLPSFVKVDIDKNMSDGKRNDNATQETTHRDSQQKNFQEIMRRIPHNAEASIVLVGQVDYLAKPAMAFVRLAQGEVLENLTEVPLPVRFLFILLVPEKSSMEYHEVGRSISTLMSNQHFHDVAYKAETRSELLQAINTFLDESIVLPPGDWDHKTLLPIMDMARRRARSKRRKKEKEEERNALLMKEKKHNVPHDPLERTKVLFGGLFNDIKRRYPHYASDFKDALNTQCVMAFIFIFFACLAPCITFGGLMEEKTKGLIGVTETVVGTAITGVVFGLFAGQPLMIVGATGPALVFEKHLLSFCKTNHIEFLPWRIWIGLWVLVITMIVLAAEGSFLVKYITRFTEEIFAVLISMIFIVEVIYKLKEIYEEHPLQFYYCDSCAAYQPPILNYSNGTHVLILNMTSYMSSAFKPSGIPSYNSTVAANDHDDDDDGVDQDYDEIVPMQHHYVKQYNQPNTALLSTILVLGTFLIAYFLRIFRNSRFLGRSARRALGDFGIFIAIIAMVLFDYFLADTYTQKLDLPEPFGPTNRRVRGWTINPMGEKYPMETWHIFIAIIPAFLFYLLLFLEVQLTEMLLHKKEMKLKKGSGFHLDQFLMGLMTFILPIFGLPWMCAATVRTIAHVSALSVMSKTHAPGEKPKLIEVKEQRVTNILMNICIGFSLALEPILRQVPMAVLFGVFLYLGISSITGVQLFRRIRLLFMPVKHHPQVGFVRRVRTSKMHLFTLIQMGLAAILWVVKSTQAAIAFPLFVFLLVPLRLKVLPFIFSKKELSELDKEEEDTEDEDDDEPDFYQRAHMPI
ncbi:hypothetical protein CHS0354_008062 [Potamilus streckersoni]|uniref:Anion exchange protein n=1 Tax=Potamilus streckersoni TaxID=2493646 RepID=A0AAE0VR14_9BIVA|nr:hypothetical protein CHS0354_008062 [Potamilus streckersoni]